MKNILYIIVVTLFILSTAHAKYVAVLETSVDKGAKELVGQSEREYLTNVLREQAVRVLPAEQNWTIMTRENISQMLPPGKSLEECEGSCLAETGKNIAADYVAQARVGKFGASLTIGAEVYETAGNKLVASFNGRSETVEGLVAVITDNAPEFFKKVRGGAGNGWGGGSGFGDFSSAGDFSVAGTKKFIVEVSTNPGGAMLSIDGRPVPKCAKTPCKIQVESGEHRFVTVLEHYDDAEELVNVKENGQKISINMAPNFGTLYINPVRKENAGRAKDLRIELDGNKVEVGTNQLDPGIHSVKITHPCYDPLEFKVAIEKGKDERFEKPLTRAKGGLSLNAEYSAEPQVVPVYIDGVDAGSTPFLGEVPLCSRITVGDKYDQEEVAVNLKYHETVEYTHSLESMPSTAMAGDESQKTAPGENGANAAPAAWDKGYNDLECETGGDCKDLVGTSIPANVENGHKTHWVPIGISAVALVAGVVLYVVGNSNAKNAADKDINSKSDYKKNRDDAKSGETLRNIGLGVAIAGAVGLTISIAF